VKVNLMNSQFTIAFIAFMLLMASQRIWETFLKKGRLKGAVEKKWTLSVLTVVHIALGVGCILEYFIVHNTINLFVTFLGLGMFFFALAGRTWAIKTLGEYHSPHIEIRKGQPLIKTGPYKYLRHPIYFFTLFELTGFTLIPNAYYSFTIALFIYNPLLMLRLYYEEQIMAKNFPEEYHLYKQEVRAMFPFRKNHSR